MAGARRVRSVPGRVLPYLFICLNSPLRARRGLGSCLCRSRTSGFALLPPGLPPPSSTLGLGAVARVPSAWVCARGSGSPLSVGRRGKEVGAEQATAGSFPGRHPAGGLGQVPASGAGGQSPLPAGTLISWGARLTPPVSSTVGCAEFSCKSFCTFKIWRWVFCPSCQAVLCLVLRSALAFPSCLWLCRLGCDTLLPQRKKGDFLPLAHLGNAVDSR